ncbi:thioredoxin family protein [Myxococcota bacterium]|nr:thioredoxin family protein [Myxococcota bacterium]MBU1431699.1 thioredoxin family protein [Myxococcota bacterium]MBU1899204.1 thioredoxin family protein [Myxococcota bacterium]
MTHTIKVLGGGCRNCVVTAKLLQEQVDRLNAAAVIEKVQDMPSIMAYGVMSTPAVVIDEVVVHAGGVPSRKQAAAWVEGLEG